MRNLAFILADELRTDVALHTKYPFVRTPNLDKLREEGITMSNAFTQYPICCPSRASIMTGKYPQQVGVLSNKHNIAPDEQTWGHFLSSLEYDAVTFGKTHRMNPGFDCHPTPGSRKSLGITNRGYMLDSETITGTFSKPKEEHHDFLVAKEFDEFLAHRDGRKPFAAFIGFLSPHPPLYPPREFDNLYSPEDIELPLVGENELLTKPTMQQKHARKIWLSHSEQVRKEIIAKYMALVTQVDECVGNVIRSLEERDLLDETIVIVTADHGDQLGEHNLLGKFHNFYEASLRAPLFFRLPGKERARVEVDQFVEMVDIYPTFCELMGIDPPDGIAGRSFTRAFTDPGYVHKEYVHSMIENGQMIRTQEWKLACYHNDRGEQYNLIDDPDEAKNLYEDPDFSEIRNQLKDEMVRHMIRYRYRNTR